MKTVGNCTAYNSTCKSCLMKCELASTGFFLNASESLHISFPNSTTSCNIQNFTDNFWRQSKLKLWYKKQTTVMTKNRITFQVIIPLLIGGFIYIFFRADSLIMFRWFDTLGLTQIIAACRQLTIRHFNLPSWIIFSLPDALWIFAFINLMLIIWKDRFSTNSIFWLLLAPSIGIFSEVGQVVKIIPGTFDIIDLTLILIASTIPFLQTIIKHKIQTE